MPQTIIKKTRYLEKAGTGNTLSQYQEHRDIQYKTLAQLSKQH